MRALGFVGARAAFAAILAGVPGVAAMAGAPGAASGQSRDARAVSRLTVEPARAEIPVGETVRLRATPLDASGTPVIGGTVRWTVLDEAPGAEVVAVDSDGAVTALRPGSTRITAISGSASASVEVTVPPLPPVRLEASAPSDVLEAGTSAPLRVEAWDRTGGRVARPEPAYESDRPDVLRIDRDGRAWAVAPGSATVTVTAGDARDRLTLRVEPSSGAAWSVVPDLEDARTGDVVRFRVDGGGSGDVYPAWSVGGAGARIEADGPDGVFVAEEPGRYTVTARIGASLVETATVDVGPREYESELVEVGRGPITGHHTGDMWVFEGVDGRDYVYVGTYLHEWAKVWDVTDPGSPVLTDSIRLDARRINDVKIHPNNRLGILTREGASDRRNGIVLLDLSTPSSPEILSEYTETVTGGVHNVWIRGEHDLVYAAHNGTSSMHVIDISDPRNPREVGRWGLEKEPRTLHDVYVDEEGYAYLSYWDDGLVMLDVGAGTHGGTPREPAFVSRFSYPVGNTHVAWRHGRYLFIGDEIFPAGWSADEPIHARGYIHVVDYADPENPVEVATYEVPEAGVHNIWAEDDRLYVGYYQAGLRVVDISGELRGDLYAQGREMARILTTDEDTMVPNWPMTWGAQLFKGRIYSSDMNSGIWITRLEGDGRVVF